MVLLDGLVAVAQGFSDTALVLLWKSLSIKQVLLSSILFWHTLFCQERKCQVPCADLHTYLTA